MARRMPGSLRNEWSGPGCRFAPRGASGQDSGHEAGPAPRPRDAGWRSRGRPAHDRKAPRPGWQNRQQPEAGVPGRCWQVAQGRPSRRRDRSETEGSGNPSGTVSGQDRRHAHAVARPGWCGPRTGFRTCRRGRTGRARSDRRPAPLAGIGLLVPGQASISSAGPDCPARRTGARLSR